MFASSHSSASSSTGGTPAESALGSVSTTSDLFVGKGTELDCPAFLYQLVSPLFVAVIMWDEGARRGGNGLGQHWWQAGGSGCGAGTLGTFGTSAGAGSWMKMSEEAMIPGWYHCYRSHQVPGRKTGVNCIRIESPPEPGSC